MGAGGERQCSLGLELGEGTFKAASRLMGPWACVYRTAGCFPFNSFFFPSLSTVFRRGTLHSDFQPGHRGPVEGSVYLFIQRADGASGCYHNEKFNRPYLLPVREQESDADILQSLN